MEYYCYSVWSVLWDYLLWLLFTNVCSSQHGGFDSREDLQLSADGGDSFTHLWKGKSMWIIFCARHRGLSACVCVTMALLTPGIYVHFGWSDHKRWSVCPLWRAGSSTDTHFVSGSTKVFVCQQHHVHVQNKRKKPQQHCFSTLYDFWGLTIKDFIADHSEKKHSQ